MINFEKKIDSHDIGFGNRINTNVVLKWRPIRFMTQQSQYKLMKTPVLIYVPKNTQITANADTLRIYGRNKF